MSDMNVDLLIERVHRNPAIWNKRHKNYTNRVVVDKCWQDISKELGASDLNLRKKWKYLRDQFSVENGKIRIENGGRVSEPRWPYYKALMFLKDMIKPRKPKIHKYGSRPPQAPESPDHQPRTDSKNGDDSLNEDVGRSYKTEESQKTLCNDSSRKRTRPDAGDLECTYSYQSQSDDLLFFKSLLPHVERIPPLMKLRFRMRVLEVVDDFANSTAHASNSNRLPKVESPDNTECSSPDTERSMSPDERVKQSAMIRAEYPK